MKFKLSDYAKQHNVTYRTAWNRFKRGLIENSYIDETGHVVIDSEYFNLVDSNNKNVVIYARVSSNENKSNLETQAQRLINYCNAKGYKVSSVVKEVGSGLNDERKKLESILLNDKIDIIVVEHKDRLCRFGLNYIQKLLESRGRHIEIVNNVDGERDDLMQDFVSIITSFCARLYGQRRTKRNTEKLIKELNN